MNLRRKAMLTVVAVATIGGAGALATGSPASAGGNLGFCSFLEGIALGGDGRADAAMELIAQYCH